MVFSDTTNKNGIVQFTEALCKLGDTGISADSVLFAQITGYINQAYKKVASAILRVDRNWRWDDTNYTDFSIASITLVNNQRDYTLPASASGGNASTLYKINQVRIKDASGDLNKIELADTITETTDTGMPTKYRLLNGSIRLEPIPITGSVTMAAGLEITFQRAMDAFTTSDTTQQPGFMDMYHELLAYDASASYLMPINPQLAITYTQIFNERLKLLQSDYALRNDDVKRRLVPNIENTR
jgi:hypothetical protein